MAPPLGLLALTAGLAAAPPGPAAPLFPARDFAEYWSAGRVHLAGGNPYDGAALLPLQRAVSGEADRTRAVSLWTPPWTLPLYWLPAAGSPRDGHLGWVAVQVLAAAAGAWLTWRTVAAGRWAWPAVVATVGFAPAWWMVVFGQNTGLLVLGLGGFLAARTGGRPVLAGAVGALTAIKPHLLAVFGLAVLLDATTSRAGRRVLVGGLLALAAGSVLSAAVRPSVFAEFATAVRQPPTAEVVPLAHWNVPTLGYKLRVLLEGDRLAADPGAGFAWQFVPLAVACVGLVGVWLARGRRWDWPADLPALVVVSALASPYGAWVFDLTVLLVPVTAALARLTAGGRPVPVAACCAALALLSLATVAVPGVGESGPGGLEQFVWVTPAVAGWCLVARHAGRGAV